MEALLFGTAATATAPATIGLFGTAGSFALAPTLMTAGTAAAAIGGIQAGNAAAASARAGQNAANYNAQMMEYNAANQRAVAAQQEDAQRRQARQILGAQRAAVSQSGIGLMGSAADIMQQSATDAELDALSLRYEGDLRARGMLAEAEQSRYQGQISGMNARAEQTGGYMNAVGSILGGAGRYAGYEADQRYKRESMRIQSSRTPGYGMGP